MSKRDLKSRYKSGDWVRLGPGRFAIKAQVLAVSGPLGADGDNVVFLVMEPIEPGEEVTVEMSESLLVPID
jgi:hypothetical protein